MKNAAKYKRLNCSKSCASVNNNMNLFAEFEEKLMDSQNNLEVLLQIKVKHIYEWNAQLFQSSAHMFNCFLIDKISFCNSDFQ